MFVDSHAHVDGSEFDADREAVLERARAAGVSTILNVGTGNPNEGVFQLAVELAQQQDDVLAAIGVHPHDARFYDDSAEQLLLKLMGESKRIVAWGEIGLDFHYDNSPRDVQNEVFRRQLKRARELGLPVIIHTREAEGETMEAIRDHPATTGAPGVLHCFTGSHWLAEQAVDAGFAISFSGIVTFKKAEELRAIAKNVPADRLLIETDCPFLAPVPHRGKRNEPAFVVDVARTLAEIRDMPIEDLASLTKSNFERIFPIRK